MMLVHRFWAIAATLAVTGWCAVPVQAGPGPACEITTLAITSGSRQDMLDVCAGARGAMAFLAGHGLDVSEPLTIEIAETLAGHARDQAAGCIVQEERRAIILDYPAFATFGTWFRIPIDRNLYRSLAAHETAHLIAECNFHPASPTLVAREYVAYVTQLATMQTGQRDRILAAFPGNGFEHDRKINETIYLFDPMRFGVEAYRHYLRPENGAEFLRSVIAGKRLAH